jgi:hypothetical protein
LEFLKCHHQGVKHDAAGIPNVVGSREGWELYIVTGSVMVGILLSEGAHFKNAESSRRLLSTSTLNG